MALCDYGCGQEAQHYLTKAKKHCCSQHPRNCPEYRKVIAARTTDQMNKASGLSPEQRHTAEKQRRAERQKARVEAGKALPVPPGQLCEYGCGQPAQHHLRPLVKDGQGTRFVWKWCCSPNYRQCPTAKAEARTKQKATTKERLGVENHQQSPQFLESYKATCQERYGVDFAPQASSVKAKREATNLERYGNRGAMSAEVLARKLATVQARYGVDNVFQDPSVQAKGRASLLRRFGVDHHMRLVSYREAQSAAGVTAVPKRRATFLERYGVEAAMQVPEFKAKSVETSLRKYGVRHYRQHGPTFRKILKGMFGFKEVMLPSGRVVKLQGYEPAAVLALLDTYPENALEFDVIPSISYQDETGASRAYHPDLFIPKDNLIIEVKSWWTLKENYEINRLKQAAALAAGYRFQFWVKDPKARIFDIIEEPLPDFATL